VNATDTLQKRNRWRVGYLLPRILALMAILEVGHRLAPAQWRFYDVGEARVRDRREGEPFARNLKLSESVGGDMVRIGNLPADEPIEQGNFTTDRFGYRNLDSDQPAAGVIFGDSFTYGARDDHDLLPVRLSEQIGCRIYNAAGPDEQFEIPSPMAAKALANRVGVNGGFVFVEAIEWNLIHPSVLAQQNWARLHVPGYWRWESLTDKIAAVLEEIRKRVGHSPFETLAERATRVLKDDRLLPNSYADNVVQAYLPNGDRMVFYHREMKIFEKQWSIQIDDYVHLAAELKKHDLKLAVLLVPSKFTVYHRLLAAKPAVAVEPGELLRRLESALRAKDISVVNLTEALRADAEAHTAERSHNYYRDDAHWNVRGIKIAAAEIARRLPDLQKACR
jgi:hypothetical protein